MAAPTGMTGTAQFSTVTPREVDFVSRFSKNWQALTDLFGIMRPIEKAPGTKLVSYVAEIDGSLAGGSTVGEGEEIPFTKFKVTEVAKDDIVIEKYAKSVSLESADKYSANITLQKSDEAFLTELQNKVLTSFYTFLKTGTATGTKPTWQATLAAAQGMVLEKFASINRTVTEVVGFANISDAYDYLGTTTITTQNAFGLTYLKDFMGYKTLFLLPAAHIPVGTVIACPVENIDLYYVNPGNADYRQLGLQYTVDGETPLIGFRSEPDYKRATSNEFAIMGMKLWAEYLDGIAKVTVQAAEG